MGKLLFASLFFLSFAAVAAPRPGHVDDRELSGRAHRLRPGAVGLDLQPDRIEVANKDAPLTIEILRMEHGQATPVMGLTIQQTSFAGKFLARTDVRGRARMATCGGAGDVTQIAANLQDERLLVTSNGRAVYRIVAEIPCRGNVRLFFDQSTNGGQALGIWQTALRGKLKLFAEVGLEFWRNPLTFIWPSDGDYYSGAVVNLTRGDHWDVVGHEMGHAIYDFARLGAFGGGSHKIDECYTPALALSEGWASYFSAWISIDPRDPDAKFEYMVPRRAPLRIENIPADVCRGTTNEWRVTGFFWDLIDHHEDGENSAAAFKPIWLSMLGKRARNMEEVRGMLLGAGYDPVLLERIWTLNF